MPDNFVIEIFSTDYEFVSHKTAERQKYEYDYMSLGTNELSVPGYLEAYKRNYIQIRAGEHCIQGVITEVEYKKLETRIRYRPLLSILDTDGYRERSELSKTSAERFLGELIEDNFVTNADKLQNIPGLRVEYESETLEAALNLTDNIHNIYDLALRAFRKYGIVCSMELNVMKKSLVCRIGVPELPTRTIEGELKNILDVEVSLKEYDDAVNKVIVIGEYSEDSEHYGETEERIFYLDDSTGETSTAPVKRCEPVVFQYKVIQIDEETFEDDAREAAVDAMYREKYDNAIKVKVMQQDPLYRPWSYQIGQPCTVRKNGVAYQTVFTGWTWNQTVTLLFGVRRKEYTKNLRRAK